MDTSGTSGVCAEGISNLISWRVNQASIGWRQHRRGAPAKKGLTGRAKELVFFTMSLVQILPPEFDVDIELKYATADNITGKPIYKKAKCYLHADAAECLKKAIAIAAPLGLRLRVYDAFRPTEAQWKLWEHTPDPEFVADPRKGSLHGRGVAVDLTLTDDAGVPLDMGTAFDAFTPCSHHGRTDIPVTAQRNRLLLAGIMATAGWELYRYEWWHYQLSESYKYPLYSDKDSNTGMM
jgi:D-alanyl-D-alanine dipeptidase